MIVIKHKLYLYMNKIRITIALMFIFSICSAQVGIKELKKQLSGEVKIPEKMAELNNGKREEFIIHNISDNIRNDVIGNQTIAWIKDFPDSKSVIKEGDVKFDNISNYLTSNEERDITISDLIYHFNLEKSVYYYSSYDTCLVNNCILTKGYLTYHLDIIDNYKQIQNAKNMAELSSLISDINYTMLLLLEKCYFLIEIGKDKSIITNNRLYDRNDIIQKSLLYDKLFPKDAVMLNTPYYNNDFGNMLYWLVLPNDYSVINYHNMELLKSLQSRSSWKMRSNEIDSLMKEENCADIELVLENKRLYRYENLLDSIELFSTDSILHYANKKTYSSIFPEYVYRNKIIRAIGYNRYSELASNNERILLGLYFSNFPTSIAAQIIIGLRKANKVLTNKEINRIFEEFKYISPHNLINPHEGMHYTYYYFVE